MNEEILSYIPQRAPFVMVDAVMSADEKEVCTKFQVDASNIFVQDGLFTEPGLMENMAQSVAAGSGYMAKDAQTPAPVGYIGALKNVVINKLPQVNDTLQTKIIFMHKVMNASIVKGAVFVNEEEIANCELKIFINEPS